MDIHIDDVFILHSSDGNDYKIVVVNINDFRPPDMKYAVDLYDKEGKHVSNDVFFIGDDFFEGNKSKISIIHD